MSSDERMPSLRVFPKDVAPAALVVGDPKRAEEAAGLLDGGREIGFYREYRSFSGTYQGKPVTISSHGVGASGANICFHELIRCGVQTIIRAGTCGAMLPEIEDGDLILGVGAVRADGTSEHLAPMSFPAIADRGVVAALEKAGRQRSVPRLHEGLLLTQAYFYPGILPSETDVWLKTGLLAGVEMEYAALLVMASLQHRRAGGIFVSDGNLTKQADPETYNPHRTEVDEGKARMLLVALDALAALS